MKLTRIRVAEADQCPHLTLTQSQDTNPENIDLDHVIDPRREAADTTDRHIENIIVTKADPETNLPTTDTAREHLQGKKKTLARR